MMEERQAGLGWVFHRSGRRTQHCTGRNGRTGSLQKDRGLGAGPHPCEITRQPACIGSLTAVSLPASIWVLSIAFNISALKYQHPYAQPQATSYKHL